MTTEKQAVMSQESRLPSKGWLVRRTLTGVLLFGTIVQIALIVYYLGAAHSPQPRDLPVGFVTTNALAEDIKAQIEKGDSFRADRYPDAASLTQAVKTKKAYGGVDLTAAQPELYVATAGGPAAATAIRNTFTQVIEQQRSNQVQKLTAAGQPVPPVTLKQLTAPPAITDVVPLPDADRGGSALGLLVQVLAVGATVASITLGKLGVHTTRSTKRGFAHAGVLVVYATVSATAVVLGASTFGIIPSGELFPLFISFGLLSLALSCSVAAAVALFGPGGAVLGTLYFLLGIIVSGASILPEFLPSWARILGQALPPGAGATLIRERLYFPDASITGPVSVLGAYAVVGLLIVLVTNALPTGKVPTAVHRGNGSTSQFW
ncbi:MAG: DUF3533 domain-containing protein [Pseudarthrobacter sp.]